MSILSGLYRIFQVAVVTVFFTEAEQELIKGLAKAGRREEADELMTAIIKRELGLSDENETIQKIEDIRAWTLVSGALTEEQKELIKSLMEAGRKEEARQIVEKVQQIIRAELDKAFSGHNANT